MVLTEEFPVRAPLLEEFFALPSGFSALVFEGRGLAVGAEDGAVVASLGGVFGE